MTRDWHVSAEPSKPRTEMSIKTRSGRCSRVDHIPCRTCWFAERRRHSTDLAKTAVVGTERPTHVCGSLRRQCAVLQWFAVSAGAVSVPITGESVPGFGAAFLNWEALCAAMRSWGCEDLSEWVHRQGFSHPRLGWPPQWQGSGTHFEWCHQS